MFFQDFSTINFQVHKCPFLRSRATGFLAPSRLSLLVDANLRDVTSVPSGMEEKLGETYQASANAFGKSGNRSAVFMDGKLASVNFVFETGSHGGNETETADSLRKWCDDLASRVSEFYGDSEEIGNADYTRSWQKDGRMVSLMYIDPESEIDAGYTVFVQIADLNLSVR
jgi:hypothetical protein